LVGKDFEEFKKRMNYKIRAADAKEVGVGNPAEETCCYPNNAMLQLSNALSTTNGGVNIYTTRSMISHGFIVIENGSEKFPVSYDT
jgi:hypothetical protein